MKAVYFVTGTDTGVGKTVVAGLLAVGLSARVPHLQAGPQDQTICRAANARSAGQPHPGG